MASRMIDGPEKEYMDITEVARFVRLSESTLKRLMREGEFPRPVNPSGQPGPRSVRLWHWRAVLYWTLRVEMRPHLRVDRAKKSDDAIKARKGHTRTAKGHLEAEAG